MPGSSHTSEDHSVQRTASRATLSSEWQTSRAALDWMSAPDMAQYVNGLVSGKQLGNNGHWAEYARDNFLAPLAEKLGRSLRMVSLGCGSGHIEYSLVEQFGWPIKELLGLEYDAEMRQAAECSFATVGAKSSFEFFDFNAPPTLSTDFDLVFCCHAIHHATDLEKTFRFVNDLMHADTLFVGIDYFGPTRFQVEYDVRRLIQVLYDLLPLELRRDLRFPEQKPPKEFAFPTIEEVVKADPSESARSSDLRTMLFANFPVVEIKPMGGTLLRWLLQYRAGNFDHTNPAHRCIAQLLQLIERQAIEARAIRSDDLFFVLKKSASI